VDTKVRVKQDGEWIDLEQSTPFKGDPEAVRQTVDQLATLDDLILWASAAMKSGTITAVRFTMDHGDVAVHLGAANNRLQFAGWWRNLNC